MQAIEAITPTESVVSTEAVAATPAKRPWQTPTCTKFTAEELTEQMGVPIVRDGSTSFGS